MSRLTGGEGFNRTRSLAVRFRYLFLFATVSVGSFLILTIKNIEIVLLHNDPSDAIWKSHRYDIIQINSEESFTIQTEGCRMPVLKPSDKRVEKFVHYPNKMKPCRNSNFSLLNNNKLYIWINKDNIYYYNLTENDRILCCYQSFYRPDAIEDITSFRVDDRVKYKDCIYFYDITEVKDEFVRVTCSVENKKVYESFFLFAHKKKFIVHDDKTEISKNKSSYNVLILGIDAVSRLNFYRTMPKTVSYMKTKGALDFMGYNKVGDNTFPNLMPMLLGIKDTELKSTCLPHGRATFDNCPFIWEWFKQAGYYTALGEDSSRLGTFNYVKVGFSRTPTDYYIHTFINEAERNAGKNKDFNSFLCMNDKHFYQILLDYIEDLTLSLRSSRLFGFFWEITMSHDYLNYPMVMDESYELFLNRLESISYLNETILLLVSDHGIRWGDIRSTKQGRLEERLPFVFILVPLSFRRKYSEAYNNLKLNSKRLTTPFDVHATLSDLVDLKNIENNVILSRGKGYYAQDRGISLFLPIPGNRTCKMAGIDDHWCTCHKGVVLSKESTEALEAAAHLVRHLNSILREYPQCAPLALVEIMEATEMITGSPNKVEVGWREFMIVIRTVPGGGVFEATLRRDSREWSLAGTVSRLNLYGDQSRCVHHYQLKLYCYCR